MKKTIKAFFRNHPSIKIKAKELSKKIKEASDKIGLSSKKLEELNAELQTIKSQLKSPRSKRAIIKESFTSIRHILEGVGGSIVAHILLEMSKYGV